MELPDVHSAGLKGRCVLLRAELNVPLANGVVVDDFRIRKALPTIKLLSKAGAKVVVLGHIGRDPKATLAPVHQLLQKYCELLFVDEVVGERAQEAVRNLSEGDILLLENLRREAGEANNDSKFASALSALGEIYVNDAFSTSHRRHTSIVGIPEILPHYAGVQLLEEVKNLTKALKPTSPSLFILGGAKFETKLPLIGKFLDIYDSVFVGGAVVHDLFRAKGFTVGHSLVFGLEEDVKSILGHPNLLLPIDVVTRTSSGEVATKKPEEVLDNDTILDAGPKTIEQLEEKVRESRTVLWNGPLGSYEEGFKERTERLAQSIATCASYSIVGGGDTIAAISKLNLEEKFTFLSTGGGGMLEFLLEGTLPGIEALRR